MKTVVLDPPPAEVGALIQRRQTLGQDRFDEVWEGVYHMTPGPSGPHAYLLSRLIVVLEPYAKRLNSTGKLHSLTGFNLGRPDDYRVPDCGFLRDIPTDTWIPTAAIVVEILSPGDETYEKFEFYRSHGVEEILVVEPVGRSVDIWCRAQPAGGPTANFVQPNVSALLGVASEVLVAAIDWPPLDD